MGKEYVKDEFENQQEIIILFIKDMIILQNALYKKQYHSSAMKGKENLYTSSLINEIVKVTDEKENS
ncbi:MAG: hypothetical protein ACLTQH_01670 [Fusobacterium sp.]